MAREKDKTAQFTMRLPQELKDEVQKRAKEEDIDAVTWIRHAIREKIERDRQIPMMLRRIEDLEKNFHNTTGINNQPIYSPNSPQNVTVKR